MPSSKRHTRRCSTQSRESSSDINNFYYPHKGRYHNNDLLKNRTKSLHYNNNRVERARSSEHTSNKCVFERHANLNAFPSSTERNRRVSSNHGGKRSFSVHERNKVSQHNNFLRKKDIEVEDIHVASKISHDLRESLTRFSARMATANLFDKNLNAFFSLIPPTFIMQHLPEEVSSFRSYLCKFQRGIELIRTCDNFES